MLHACRIKDGKVSYCNRHVQTNRLNQERKAKHPIFSRVSPPAHCNSGLPVEHLLPCIQRQQYHCTRGPWTALTCYVKVLHSLLHLKAAVNVQYGDIQGGWGLVHLFLDKTAGFFNIWNDKVRHASILDKVMSHFWSTHAIHSSHSIACATSSHRWL